MTLAAMIIATISLILSIAAITWQLAKHFSTHAIQYVPLDPFGSVSGGPQKSHPLEDAYQEFDRPKPQPLDPSEEEYFKQYNKA